MNFNHNVLYRPLKDKNMYKEVTIFYSKRVVSPTKLYLTIPVKPKGDNVLIASVDIYATQRILDSYQNELIQHEVQPLFIANCISEHLRIPLVTILCSYCTLDKKEEVYEVHHLSPKSQSIQDCRSILEDINKA